MHLFSSYEVSSSEPLNRSVVKWIVSATQTADVGLIPNQFKSKTIEIRCSFSAWRSAIKRVSVKPPQCVIYRWTLDRLQLYSNTKMFLRYLLVKVTWRITMQLKLQLHFIVSVSEPVYFLYINPVYDYVHLKEDWRQNQWGYLKLGQ